MGNLIKWKSIDSESTFDIARIYRASSETGTYSQIATQDISDTSYYDPNGTTSSWYKIEFYDSVNDVISSKSTALQADTYIGYCRVQDIRDLTNISSNDLDDTEVANIIAYAGTELNATIQVHEEEEEIGWISQTKENDIDGSNTTFYTRHYPVGDLDDDMDVDTSDLTVYVYDADGDRTQATVSSIIPDTGKFVLSTAPASTSSKVTVTYTWCQRSIDQPHPLVKQACLMLSAAYAYSKINIGKAPRFRMGSTQIWRDMKSFERYYEKYIRIIDMINDREMASSIEGETF